MKKLTILSFSKKYFQLPFSFFKIVDFRNKSLEIYLIKFIDFCLFKILLLCEK